METQFSKREVPTLTDEASTITAENAVSARALLGAVGGVSKLTVVTSDWHRFRAWIYFAKLFRLERCEVRIAAAGPDSATIRDRLPEVRWMTHIPRNVRQANRLESDEDHVGSLDTRGLGNENPRFDRAPPYSWIVIPVGHIDPLAAAIVLTLAGPLIAGLIYMFAPPTTPRFLQRKRASGQRGVSSSN